MIYQKEEVLQASIAYFNGNEQTAKIWINKYALKNEKDELLELTPLDMHWRLAREFARIEQQFKNPLKVDEILEVLKDFQYIVPQGSPMFGIGNDYQIVSLSNCTLVPPPEDSIGGIWKTDEQLAQLSKRRCGVGVDVGTLRPKGTVVSNSAGTTTGTVSFAEQFSNTIQRIGQNGRRGALMISIDIRHPDIIDFINAKLVDGKISGANISVRIDDKFMSEVISGENTLLYFPISDDKTCSGIVKEMPARDIWNLIVENSWKSAEPGILFWNTILNNSPARGYWEDGFKEQGVNPCAEIPLCSFDSCRLITYNLYGYVDNPFTKDAKFNFDKLAKHARIMGKLADDIVELEIEKIEKILEKIANDKEDSKTKQVEFEVWSKIQNIAIVGRRCGIGITALGDTIAALGYKYGSKEGNIFAKVLQNFIRDKGIEVDIDLAKERGHFPIWNYSKDIQSKYINRWLNDPTIPISIIKKYKKYGRRGIGLFTIAPTGTTSIMCKIGNYFGTTSGIEPAFAISSSRRRKCNPDETPTYTDEFGEKWLEMGNAIHPGLLEYCRINNLVTDGIAKVDLCNNPYYKATAHDIDPITKVQLQGMLQQYIDHSISCTVNMHKDSTKEQVADVLLAAWKEGCKGITVYLDGCRQGIITTDTGKNVPVPINNTRPDKLECDIHHVLAEGQAYLVMIGKLNNNPYEIFAFKRTDESDGAIMLKKDVVKGYILKDRGIDGKSVYSLDTEQVVLHNMGKLYITGEEQAITRGYSALLQSGIGIDRVVEILRKVPTNHISSMVSVITRVLSTYTGKTVSGEKCPECNSELIYIEGCKKCSGNCGYSKCG